jgi:hypothetical protein
MVDPMPATTEEALREILDSTERTYADCWQVLASLIGQGGCQREQVQFFHFQPTLAAELFRLDGVYRRIEKESSELVTKKEQVPRDWFLTEIRRLGRYQQAIADAIDLGKALGNAFAWPFYREHGDQLKRHWEHVPITEPPTGVGAAGEVEFIGNSQVLNGNLVLYHGITTFLRIGDVSFIDLNTLRLNGLGEIKSRACENGDLEITVHCVGPKDRPFFTPTRAPISSRPPDAMPDKIAQRFRRQLESMANSFQPVLSKDNLKIEKETYVPMLLQLEDELKASSVAYRQCGEGLLLVAFRVDADTSLFSRLLKSTSNMQEHARDLGAHVLRLIDRSQIGSPDNANGFTISSLGTGTLPGTIPLFWWPISASLARKLYFQDIAIATIYNPAHMIRKLRNHGFEMQFLDGGRRHRFKKRYSEGCLAVERFDYFMSLIQHNLIREELVIEALSYCGALVETGKVGPNTRIDFDIRQQFGRRPDRSG